MKSRLLVYLANRIYNVAVALDRGSDYLHNLALTVWLKGQYKND